MTLIIMADTYNLWLHARINRIPVCLLFHSKSIKTNQFFSWINTQNQDRLHCTVLTVILKCQTTNYKLTNSTKKFPKRRL